MPISALTNHVGSTVMSLATLTGNNQLIEDYLRGEIDAADFQNLIGRPFGLPGSNHRAYIQTDGLDCSIEDLPDSKSWSDVYGTPIPYDRDGVLDFTIYGADRSFYVTGISTEVGAVGGVDDGTYDLTEQFSVSSQSLINRFTWERLGSNPRSKSDPTKELTTAASSWCNWLYNAPYPPDGGVTNFIDSRRHAGRFNKDYYYDRWLTVPHCSKRIWVPEAGTLYVIASCEGTWNHSMGQIQAETKTRYGSQSEAGFTNWAMDRSAFFRLFVDADGSDSVPFSWASGGENFTANWTTIQDLEAESTIGYAGSIGGKNENMGWEYSCRSYPRGLIRAANRIWIPEAGYYNISLRYNQRYIHGRIHGRANPPDRIESDWRDDRFAYTGNNFSGCPDIPGPIHTARWHKSQIGAIVHFIQDPGPNILRRDT